MACHTNAQQFSNSAAPAGGIRPVASQYAYTAAQFRPAWSASTPPARFAPLRKMSLTELRAAILQAALQDQAAAEKLAQLGDKELLLALGQCEAEWRRRNKSLRRLEFVQTIRRGWTVIQVFSYITTFRELAELLILGKLPKPKRAARISVSMVTLVTAFVVYRGVRLGVSELLETYRYKMRERQRHRLIENLNRESE